MVETLATRGDRVERYLEAARDSQQLKMDGGIKILPDLTDDDNGKRLPGRGIPLAAFAIDVMKFQVGTVLQEPNFIDLGIKYLGNTPEDTTALLDWMTNNPKAVTKFVENIFVQPTPYYKQLIETYTDDASQKTLRKLPGQV